MSESSGSGLRQSQWLVIQRCLRLLQRLMREPTTGADLKKIIIDHADEIGDGHIYGKAVDRRFEEDRKRLDEWFGCVIERDPKTTLYTLVDFNCSLIDLSDKSAQAIAFLKSNFSSPNIPMGAEIRELIGQMIRVIPHSTRRSIERERRVLELGVSKDADQIDDRIWEDIEVTITHHRLLRMSYRAAADDQSCLYEVEPDRYAYENGHFYLYARSRVIENPAKKNLIGKRLMFRVDRILSTHPLADYFTPIQPITSELEYILSPEVARGGVTEHFKGQQVFMQQDGSAKISVASENLFIDLRKLLHYGTTCQVIGGDEAVRQMKEIIGQMTELYK